MNTFEKDPLYIEALKIAETEEQKSAIKSTAIAMHNAYSLLTKNVEQILSQSLLNNKDKV